MFSYSYNKMGLFLNFPLFEGNIMIPAISKIIGVWGMTIKYFFPKWKIGKLRQRASLHGSQTPLQWPVALEALLKFIKTQDSQVPLHSYWLRMTVLGTRYLNFQQAWEINLFLKNHWTLTSFGGKITKTHCVILEKKTLSMYYTQYTQFLSPVEGLFSFFYAPWIASILDPIISVTKLNFFLARKHCIELLWDLIKIDAN